MFLIYKYFNPHVVLFFPKFRSQADQPTIVPNFESLTEMPKEPVEKPPPKTGRLKRSHTDPTDLLEVFRRRANLVAQQNDKKRVLPRRKNGCVEPYRPENGGCRCFDERSESNEGLVDQVKL